MNEFGQATITEGASLKAKMGALPMAQFLEELKAGIARLQTNRPPTEAEMRAFVEELERRFPGDPDVEILSGAFDLDNKFGNSATELLESARRLYRDHPENSIASSLLVYGMMAQGFSSFAGEIGKMVARHPSSPDFQYAAAAVDLANGENKKAIERLRFVQSVDPGFKKAGVALKKIARHRQDRPIVVDEVMDFRPTIDPNVLDQLNRR